MTMPVVPVAAPLGAAKTERLELRAIRRTDLDSLAEVFAAQEVWEHPLGRGMTRDETAGFIERQVEHWSAARFGLWLAIERSTRTTLGFVGLSTPTFLPSILPAVEVGWRLHPSAWGRGYATEGARAAITAGFETLGLDSICSLPQTTNAASIRVAERLSMRFERKVEVPANHLRGPVRASLFRIAGREWPASDQPPPDCPPIRVKR